MWHVREVWSVCTEWKKSSGENWNLMTKRKFTLIPTSSSYRLSCLFLSTYPLSYSPFFLATRLDLPSWYANRYVVWVQTHTTHTVLYKSQEQPRRRFGLLFQAFEKATREEKYLKNVKKFLLHQVFLHRLRVSQVEIWYFNSASSPRDRWTGQSSMGKREAQTKI